MERLTREPIDLTGLFAQSADPRGGALVLFAGTVRRDPGPPAVRALHYTAEEGLCERVLAAIEREAVERFGLARCSIRHRIGHLAVGDVSVAVLVRSAHRDEGFAAARWVIDAIKRRAPIWKEEEAEDGSRRHVPGTRLPPDEGSAPAPGG